MMLLDAKENYAALSIGMKDFQDTLKSDEPAKIESSYRVYICAFSRCYGYSRAVGEAISVKQILQRREEYYREIGQAELADRFAEVAKRI